MLVAVALTDYGRLSTAGVLFSLTLAGATLCIAAGEELIFRGIVLRFLRLRYREQDPGRRLPRPADRRDSRKQIHVCLARTSQA